ncbi:hypothetical protein [Flavivirga jejuensis]|uniref:Uncharacterized protein n=1 Tax=Flavivirga jejuensis TaxID=870487 RepID=A0ABT8WK49_9FLAO|nr:hypothetical protein [Flavivirga jejuensis]MDO5973536.1 hypothetical protein [Flavivirga jejuensis]
MNFTIILFAVGYVLISYMTHDNPPGLPSFPFFKVIFKRQVILPVINLIIISFCLYFDWKDIMPIIILMVAMGAAPYKTTKFNNS